LSPESDRLKHTRIIFRHVLPNSLSPVIVYGTLMMAGAILDAAALGFLGLGAQPQARNGVQCFLIVDFIL